MCSSFVFPAELFLEARVRKGRRTEQGVESSASVQIRLVDAEFRKDLVSVSRQFAGGANRQFQFHKGAESVICQNNEPATIPGECVWREKLATSRIYLR